ncbi:MAG: DUF5666 domain-containing protein [Bryobacteraceae bacterium]
MKRWLGLCLGVLVSLFLVSGAVAQEKKAKKAEAKKEDRLSGRIQMINKDTSTITLERNNVRRTVVYSPDTKITYRNKPGTMDDVKEGRRVIVLGKFNDKAQLVATRIDVREGK